MDFVYFSSLGWKVQGFIWENIRNVSFWKNIRTETSFWGNIRIFLILDDLECSISGNIKGIFFGWKCFGFFGLGCEVNKVAVIYTADILTGISFFELAFFC